jgi:hypothetical protein
MVLVEPARDASDLLDGVEDRGPYDQAETDRCAPESRDHDFLKEGNHSADKAEGRENA